MRTPLLAALLAVALATTTSHAAPAAQFTDAKGDWAVASQDVLSARISSVLAGGAPAIRAELTLAAAPDPTLPSSYNVQFAVGCVSYALTYDGKAATLQQVSCTRQPATTTAPATASVRGTTLVLQAPYALGLRRGQVAGPFAAVAYTAFAGFGVGLGPPTVCTCDLAYSPDRSRYVLGSDLPRK